MSQRPNKPKDNRPTKAVVFIWPNLNKDQLEEVEADCVYAGYTSKRKVKVGKVTCYEVT